MFDFKKEISKYKPMHEIDEIEQVINENEIQDIMDMLKMLERDNQAVDKNGNGEQS
jgi:hypothetical protein